MCAYFSYCASLFVLVILHIPHAKRVWGQTEDSPTTLNSSSSSIPSPTPPSSIEILAIYVIPGIGNSIRVIWGADTDREMGNFTFGLFYGEDEGEFNYPKLTTSNLSVIVEDLEYCTRYSFAVTLDDGGGFDISKINPNLVRSIVTGIDPLAAPTNLTIDLETLESPCLAIKWSAACSDVVFPVGYVLSVFEKNMSRYKIITFPPNKRTDLIYKLGVSYGDEYEVRVSNNFPGAKAVGPMMYKVPAFLQPFKVKVAVNAEEGAFMIYWEEPFVPIRVGSYYYQAFAKVYDSVEYVVLLSKLHKFGLSKGLLIQIASYLSHRKQFDFFRRSSVPQELNLEPLFYLLLMDDLRGVFVYPGQDVTAPYEKYYVTRPVMVYKGEIGAYSFSVNLASQDRKHISPVTTPVYANLNGESFELNVTLPEIPDR